MKVDELKKALPGFSHDELVDMLDTESRATAKEALQSELDARENGPDEEVAAQEAILARIASISAAVLESRAAIDKINYTLADAREIAGEAVSADGVDDTETRKSIIKLFLQIEALANHFNFRLPG